MVTAQAARNKLAPQAPTVAPMEPTKATVAAASFTAGLSDLAKSTKRRFRGMCAQVGPLISVTRGAWRMALRLRGSVRHKEVFKAWRHGVRVVRGPNVALARLFFDAYKQKARSCAYLLVPPNDGVSNDVLGFSLAAFLAGEIPTPARETGSQTHDAT